jgi:uncharacterized protein (TIGR02646 family)
MIRVRKSEKIPASLQKPGNTSYNHPDVVAQLLNDHDGKCYLCERICVTDYQIEHLLSQEHFPGSATSWDNLFLSCSYCNGKKQHHFDAMLNPSACNVEDRIVFFHDVSTKKVTFTAVCTDENTGTTIALLHKIFNGAGSIRKIKEERFYNYFLYRMNRFLQNLSACLSDTSAENRQALAAMLDIKDEFLAFKYHIIKNNAALSAAFDKDMVWNKQLNN